MKLLSPFSKNVVWQLAKLTRSRCLTFWIHLGTVRPLLHMILNPLFKKKNSHLKISHSFRVWWWIRWIRTCHFFIVKPKVKAIVPFGDVDVTSIGKASNLRPSGKPINKSVHREASQWGFKCRKGKLKFWISFNKEASWTTIKL